MKRMRRRACHLEYATQSGLGLLRRHTAAGQRGVETPRTFDVDGKKVDQPVFQQRLDDVGLHAVGIQLTRKTQLPQLGQQQGQPRRQCGLAAADHHAVQPFLPGLQKGQHGLTRQYRQQLRRPGQLGVVTGRAAQGTAAEKKDTRVTSGPVAKAETLQPAYVIPWSSDICSHRHPYPEIPSNLRAPSASTTATIITTPLPNLGGHTDVGQTERFPMTSRHGRNPNAVLKKIKRNAKKSLLLKTGLNLIQAQDLVQQPDEKRAFRLVISS